MKILFVSFLGPNGTGMAKAIREAGAEVLTLGVEPFESWGGSLLSKVQRRLNWGPGIRAFNRELLRRIVDERPDAVWVFKGTMLQPGTIERARRIHPCVWVHENPDDPFGPQRGHHWWKLFYRTLPLFDLHFVYRGVGVMDYAAAGARRVERVNFFFLEGVHVPPPEGSRPDFDCDVALVGRWEPERHYAAELLARRGLRVRVWGPFWPQHMRKPVERLDVGGAGVFGPEYAKALWRAKMGLNVLTRLNRDSHALRSLEVPACGCAQLAERTLDHQDFLEEGAEAEFFDTWEEMVEKASALAADPGKCLAMGRRAAERVRRDGRDAVSKARRQIEIIAELIRG